jgi:hypothetical protein
LIAEQAEAVSRLVLRPAIQLDLKFPNLARCCQTHRSITVPLLLHEHTQKPGPSPLPVSSGLLGVGSEVAPLARWPPSAAQTWCAGFPRHAFTKTLDGELLSAPYDPLRPADWPPPCKTTFRVGTSAQSRGLPQLPGSPSLNAGLTTPVDRIRCSSVDLLARSRAGFDPVPTAFPVMQTGRHPQLTFEACSSFTHVTAYKLLTHHTWAFARPVLASFLARTLATKPYQQLLGRVLPPLVIRALKAHCINTVRCPSQEYI